MPTHERPSRQSIPAEDISMWLRVDGIVKRFEHAWRCKEHPAIEDYLTADGRERQALLSELIHVDLEFRLRDSEDARVEDYLVRFPELGEDSSRVLSLVGTEIKLRRGRGESPQVEEVVARFPAQAAAVQALLLKAASDVGPVLPVAVPGSDVETVDDVKPVTPRAAAVDPDLTPPLVPGCNLQGGRDHVKFGGMGVVYFGTDNALHRPVAVKVLRRRLAGRADLMGRFEAEAQVCAQLQHPGIVPVHQVGRLGDGRPFYVMKLVKGDTLGDLLKKRASPAHDLLTFLSHFHQVCAAMAYAHARDVIHRDLKPANVMVGSFGEVLLMDWGLAKVVTGGTSAETTRDAGSCGTIDLGGGDELRAPTLGALGTLAYMPPEQAAGRIAEVDKRSDVFGLGAILCVVLTNQPPYVGPSSDVVLRRAQQADLAETFARLSTAPADAELVALARQCLSPRREDRPTDASAVALAMTQYFASVEERKKLAELEQKEAAVRAEERLRQAELERKAAEDLAQERLRQTDALLAEEQERRFVERQKGRLALYLTAVILVLAGVLWYFRQHDWDRADTRANQVNQTSQQTYTPSIPPAAWPPPAQSWQPDPQPQAPPSRRKRKIVPPLDLPSQLDLKQATFMRDLT
jgi:serine/threonine protein kinase